MALPEVFAQALQRALGQSPTGLAQASPLDQLRVLAAQQNQQRMANVPQAPLPQGSPSVMDRINAGLSGRNALVNAGLSLLGQRGHDGPAIGEALLGGAALARQRTEQDRMLAEQRGNEKRLSDAIAKLDIDEPTRAAVQALPLDDQANYILQRAASRGDQYQVAGDKLWLLPGDGSEPRLISAPEEPEPVKPVEVSPGNALVDPVTGKVIFEAPFSPSQLRGGSGGSGGSDGKAKPAVSAQVESILGRY